MSWSIGMMKFPTEGKNNPNVPNQSKSPFLTNSEFCELEKHHF